MSQSVMQPLDSLNLPALLEETAFFFDLDGTLAAICSHPSQVSLEPDVLKMLRRLRAQAKGALAIVSGRSLESLTTVVTESSLDLVSEHGAAFRLQNVESTVAGLGFPFGGRAYGRLTDELQGLEYAWVEQKRYGVAIHYDPGSTEALAVIKAVERFISSERGLDIGILHGKNVLELKHSVATKGTAIQHLLNTSPYKGRIPFVIGDDRTDESAFLVANKVGGLSVKVGRDSHPTCATYFTESPASLHRWLATY